MRLKWTRTDRGFVFNFGDHCFYINRSIGIYVWGVIHPDKHRYQDYAKSLPSAKRKARQEFLRRIPNSLEFIMTEDK